MIKASSSQSHALYFKYCHYYANVQCGGYYQTQNERTSESAISEPISLTNNHNRNGCTVFLHHAGVLKFMAGDKVDRNTAQAEMDAYLQNPNDWACKLFSLFVWE